MKKTNIHNIDYSMSLLVYVLYEESYLASYKVYRSAELLPLRRAGVAEVVLPMSSLGKSGDRRHWDESPS